jgi:uridylate kinase
MAESKTPIVISLGGSLIVPNGGINYHFLKRFRDLIVKHVGQGRRFVIITGGGKIARHYQEAARKIINIHPEDIDWIGIHATRLNAHLLRTIFRKRAHPKLFWDPNDQFSWRKPILIGAGWKPGSSTDYIATLAAQKFKAQTVINLSNIDYVYDRDPKKYKNAKRIKEIEWKDFKKMMGGKWIPGANLPFDPVASRLAEKLKLRVVVMNGRRLGEFEKALKRKSFHGSLIH